MNLKIENIINNFYMKILLGTIIVFIGLSSGMYFTRVIIGKQDMSIPDESLLMAKTLDFPNFEKGDLFPLVDYVSSTGKTNNFEGILKDKKSLIFFLDPESNENMNHLLLYDNKLLSELTDIKTILCLDNSFNNKEYYQLTQDLSKRHQVVFVDYNYFKENYNIKQLPTTFALDKYGFIQVIQVGKQEFISHELYRFLK